MKHETHKKIFFLNLLIIILGGAALLWFYFIDGKVVNKPIIFPNTDPMNFQVDKEVYQVGETPSLYTDFCKTRNAKGSVEWSLVDGQKVQFSPRPPAEVPIGCYPNNQTTDKIKSPLHKIPVYMETTCDAHFVGVGRIEISGGREVIYNYKTENFCIEGGEEDLLEVII